MYYDKNRLPCCDKRPMLYPQHNRACRQCSKDYGPNPFVTDIEKQTLQSGSYRRVLWTGDDMQLTVMSLEPGEDIGLEVHHGLDQFIRIEEGQGIVKMGDSKNYLDFRRGVQDDDAIIIPSGKWHNLINTGSRPLKLYSIYTTPQHSPGEVQRTKSDAEHDHHR